MVLLFASLVGCLDGSVDCDHLPEVGELIPVPGARGHNGLAFDGPVLVGSDGTSLVRTTRDGTASVWVPGVGSGEQLAFLPGGALAFVDSSGTVLRIEPDGGIVRLAELGAYGLTVGPDGMIYTANLEVVHRVDPETGEATVYIDAIELPKVVGFGPKAERVYVGTALTEHGDLWELDIDPATLDPTSTPRLLATTGPWSWQDALGVDTCGNLYVPEFHGGVLWRFSADGAATRLVEFSEQTYGHGLAWGSGVQGWSATSLFLPHPNDGSTVSELEIGIPAAR